MKHKWQGNKKIVVDNVTIEQMAREYKSGSILRELQSKYNIPMRIIAEELLGFKASWFDYRYITTTHKHNCEGAIHGGLYKNFERTLRDVMGLRGVEVTTVVLALSKRITNMGESANSRDVHIQPGVVDRILKKVRSKVIAKLLKPYVNIELQK